MSGNPPWYQQSPTIPGSGGVSQGHLNAMYVAVHERVSFELDNGMIVFPSKNKGQNRMALPEAANIDSGLR